MVGRGYVGGGRVYEDRSNRVIGGRNGRVFEMDMEEALKMEYQFEISLLNRINAL